MLSGSGLPEPTVARLRSWANMTVQMQLSAAIELARSELAALAEIEAIDLPGPSHPVNSGDMLTAGDRAQSHVDWVFGVPGCGNRQPPNYRRFS